MGVQGKAAERVCLGAVFLVAGHGVAHLRRVDTDLVLSAGLQGELGLGIVAAAPEYLVMRDGQLAVFHFLGEGHHFQGLGILC